MLSCDHILHIIWSGSTLPHMNVESVSATQRTVPVVTSEEEIAGHCEALECDRKAPATVLAHTRLPFKYNVCLDSHRCSQRQGVQSPVPVATDGDTLKTSKALTYVRTVIFLWHFQSRNMSLRHPSSWRPRRR